MENISVNALVDSYENHLPREIQLEIAKSILAESFGKTEALQEFAKKIEANGAVKILNLANNGTGYVKVNNAGTLSYSSTRSVAAGEVSVQLDSDDPTSFQTVYVAETDADGNEIQMPEQEYIGSTEDLLSIIKDLRARVAALESNEVVDDATDSALLTLVASLATRVSALEGA